MKPLFFFISLLCSSFTASSIIADNIIFNHRDDLRLFLDWCDKYSKVYQSQKQGRVHALNERLHRLMISNEETIGQLHNFMSAVVTLRSVLVKGSSDGIFINNQLEDNVEIIITFIVTMSFVFDDLQKNIEEWMNDEQMLRKSLTVMDEKPLKWFNEHGFEESTLKDVTISVLEEEVSRFYGDGQPFDDLVSYIGTFHTELYDMDVSSKLAWLFAFVTNQEALGYLDSYLQRECDTLQLMTTTEFIEQLRMLGKEGGHLHRLFGNGRDDKLYPFIMPIFKKAVYFQEMSEQYFKIIINIFSRLELDVTMVQNALIWYNDVHKHLIFWQQGFFYDIVSLNVEGAIKTMEALIGWDGYIRPLNIYFMNCINGEEIKQRYLNGGKMSLPKPLLTSGMVAMGIHPSLAIGSTRSI